jgi:hypothetical protein
MTTHALRAGLLAATLGLGALAPACANQIVFDTHASITTSEIGTKPKGGVAGGAALLSNDYTTFAYAAAYGISFGQAGSSAGSVVITGVGSGGSGNAVCGLDLTGNVSSGCKGDQYFYFTTTDALHKTASTSGLSFDLGDGVGTRAFSWIVHLYDVNNTELVSRTVASSGKYTTVAFTETGINRVWIENTTAVGGYFLDTINFAAPVLATRVPEPASLGLFGLGLAALLARRTRRAHAAAA